MTLTLPEVNDIIERVALLRDPCLFEIAEAVRSQSWPNNIMSQLLELRDRNILVFLDSERHPLLVSIARCTVCSWAWPRTRAAHEAWYTGNTQCYRHIYMPTPV
jgi:hypothetical protein